MQHNERDRHTALTLEAKNKQCLRCKEPPRVAWLENQYNLRCGCYPEEPKLTKQPEYKAERLGDMVNATHNDLVVSTTTGEVVTNAPADNRTLTIDEVKARKELMKYVVGEMQENIHYGVIPGTKDRSLWEAGAEYLRAAFNIQWDYDLVDSTVDRERHEYRYEFRVYQLMPNGMRVGGWMASCWSKEKKFRNMEPEMLPHNVKDRALKRGFVAMIRNVVGATGYFKQDLDLMASAPDPDQVICSEHGVPFTFNPDGRYGPYYKHSLPKSPKGHSVSEKKIAEFTQKPTRATQDAPEQASEVESDE